MTPEQEAVKLIEEHGTIQAAADASGIPRSTLHARAQRARGGDAGTPVSEDEPSRVRELEQIVAQQQQVIERQRKPRIRLNAAAPLATHSGDFTRVIVPDSHGCHIDEAAAGAFLHDLAALKPREVVMIGDHIDCGGFLAQHHTLGYVAETSYTFEDDVSAANSFLDSIQSAAPGAEIHYLEGNHERRIETWCVTQALRNRQDAAYLARMFSTEHVLSLEKRGISYYKQGACYHGLKIPGTIKLGRCYFTHGSRCGVHAAKQTLGDFGGNVVFGHTHRIQSFQSWNVSDGDMCAWNIGFLSKTQPYWRHQAVSGWSHGYGVQFVRENGDFLHVTVPIINGESYFVPLVSQVG